MVRILRTVKIVTRELTVLALKQKIRTIRKTRMIIRGKTMKERIRMESKRRIRQTPRRSLSAKMKIREKMKKGMEKKRKTSLTTKTNQIIKIKMIRVGTKRRKNLFFVHLEPAQLVFVLVQLVQVIFVMNLKVEAILIRYCLQMLF